MVPSKRPRVSSINRRALDRQVRDSSEAEIGTDQDRAAVECPHIVDPDHANLTQKRVVLLRTKRILRRGAAGTVIAEGSARLIVCLVGPKLTERQMIRDKCGKRESGHA